MRKYALIVVVLLSSIASAEDAPKFTYIKPETPEFYIYKDNASKDNHYIPSGWMGSYQSLKMNLRSTENPQSGVSCIQFTYDIDKDPVTAWIGVYWQTPPQNWGNMRGGFNLSNYKKLTFWARGGEGNEAIESFGAGGITGQEYDGDSTQVSTDRIILTKDWKKYEIDLKGEDMSHIIGGFFFSVSAEYNTKDVVFYLDDIRYEK